MDSLDRDQASDLVQRYGGRVTGSVSSKTSYVVLGEEPGASKLEAIKKHNVQTLSEDELLEMVRTRPTQQAVVSKSAKDMRAALKKPTKASAPSSDGEASPVKPSLASSQSASAPAAASQPARSAPEAARAHPASSTDDQMLSDKYRPRSSKDIVGNPGLVKQLLTWLQNWDATKLANSKDGYRAALLSGAPGIGKTSTAHVVAREAGFEVLEFNASDTRSKKTLELAIGDSVDNRSISEFFGASRAGGAAGKGAAADKHKIVLVMDEVDGMSGGDRGGMGELIKLIKNTKVPIICICNDASNPKVRSLQNHCLHLRFRRYASFDIPCCLPDHACRAQTGSQSASESP